MMVNELIISLNIIMSINTKDTDTSEQRYSVVEIDQKPLEIRSKRASEIMIRDQKLALH